MYILALARSMSSCPNECLVTQIDRTLIGCPYLATTIEYLAKIVSFFLSTKITTHNKKCDPLSMPPCKWMCHGVSLSYVVKQNEKILSQLDRL